MKPELTRVDALSLIDQINQYKLGNVTELGLLESLTEAVTIVEAVIAHDKEEKV